MATSKQNGAQGSRTPHHTPTGTSAELLVANSSPDRGENSKTCAFKPFLSPQRPLQGATCLVFQRTLSLGSVCVCVCIPTGVQGILLCIYCYQMHFFVYICSWVTRNRSQIPPSKTQWEHMFRSALTIKWDFFVISIQQKQLKTICLLQENWKLAPPKLHKTLSLKFWQNFPLQ